MNLPNPIELWFYLSTNLLVDANVEKLEQLFERAGKAGYSKVLLADSKFSRLAEMEPRYFQNVERAKAAAAKNHLAIVPAIFPIGYSEGLLSHDPNLAEALLVKDDPFVVVNGEARPEAKPIALTKPEWKDDVFKEEGGESGKPGGWRCRDAGATNARLVFKLKVAPFRAYHLALTIETKEFEGEPRAQVLVEGGGLLFSNLGVQKSQPPTRHHAVFNSLDHDEVRLYVGAWGAGSGELAIRDITLEEAGLVNLVRREDATFEVSRVGKTDGERGARLIEGRDFEPVSDPKMGTVPWRGGFEVWHEPPPIRTKLPDGTRLLVSWSHAITVLDGQTMICLSEPKTLELLEDECRRIGALFGKNSGTAGTAAGSHEYFLSHDEIRVLNQDESCRAKKLDAGALLAENARACTKIVRGVDPAAQLWIWSDMFDPTHNAAGPGDGRGSYYLVRGDLRGAWEGLDPAVSIADWNFDRRDESLAFFAGRGHRLLLAGYYDAPSERIGEIDAWLASARRLVPKTPKSGAAPPFVVMYTTWQSRYDDLERFAARVRDHDGG